MPTSNIESLEAALSLLAIKEQELAIIQQIDEIRDSQSEPARMLNAIVQLLSDSFHTDLCFLALLNEHSQELELKVTQQGPHTDLHPLINADIAQKILNLTQVTRWRSQDLPALNLPAALQKSLHLVALPIVLGQAEVLGAILLARLEKPFDDAELQVLNTAEDHIDSAIVQTRQHQKLALRVQELEAIYRIDHIRDQATSIDQLLDMVLEALRSTLSAEMAFVMLYNHQGHQLEMRAATDLNLFNLSPYYELVYGLAYDALERGNLTCHHHINQKLQSIMCHPLILNRQFVGVIGVVNHLEKKKFAYKEQQLLHAIGSQMDTAIFENLEKRRLRNVLDRSVGPHIMARLLNNADVDFLKGERHVISVLYVDIRGSTSLAEQTEPELLVGFINHYLSRMTEIILDHEATLDKFVGDEVMALFGAPVPQVDHALRAVRVGLEMQTAYEEIQHIWHDRNVFAGPIGVGIATGELIVGEMGSIQRADYTAIGKAANLGSRICSAAQGGQVLVCPETYRLVQNQVKAKVLTGLQFKGVAGPVTVYEIEGLI